MPVNPDKITIGAVQTSPVWLNKAETTKKVIENLRKAKERGCDLVAFGEVFIPGYPHWLSPTNASSFDKKEQKEIFAHYSAQSVCIEDGDLDPICAEARSLGLAVVLGVVERPRDRGGQTLYCCAVYVDSAGEIQSTHRKLMPTYEERLVWGIGDGHGLRTHRLGGFTVSVLNCWENWMPLSRSAMYAQGSTLHVALWPGSDWLTKDITRFIAKEGRCYVLSVGATLKREEITSFVPHHQWIKDSSPPVISNGGTCLAGPDGKWIVEPLAEAEDVLTVTEIDMARVRQERQNFDPAGHYSRPDITRLVVNRERQAVAEFKDK